MKKRKKIVSEGLDADMDQGKENRKISSCKLGHDLSFKISTFNHTNVPKPKHAHEMRES
jgi:hypothetical protein